jgi:glycolate oxidase FAD binding subunit
MTALKGQLAKLAKGVLADPVPDAPAVDFTVAPSTATDAAAILRFASDHRLRVLFWGGGTHQSFGYPVDPDVVMTTSQLTRVVDWQPEDLTIVVEPGLSVEELHAMLEQRDQTAVLPEMSAGATVGGVIAAGLSGWSRLRYGPTRDRVLEVELATGDGRVVRGGGRLVKNVTGYDLPRLATGSLGSLGLIASVCLKLWPLTVERAMVEVTDLDAAMRLAYRPHAIVETNDSTTVYLAGTAAEIEAQADLIGGRLTSGHRWPVPLTGSWELFIRVPPGAMRSLVDLVKDRGWPFQAAHGIGEIRFVVGNEDTQYLASIRTAAESTGGSLVVGRAPRDTDFDLDPWGAPPDAVDLQRRVKAAFDPVGIANPGRLPGGI